MGVEELTRLPSVETIAFWVLVIACLVLLFRRLSFSETQSPAPPDSAARPQLPDNRAKRQQADLLRRALSKRLGLPLEAINPAVIRDLLSSHGVSQRSIEIVEDLLENGTQGTNLSERDYTAKEMLDAAREISRRLPG